MKIRYHNQWTAESIDDKGFIGFSFDLYTSPEGEHIFQFGIIGYVFQLVIG